MTSKPHTVQQLKDLLRLANVPFVAKAKLADLRQLCEDHRLVARPPPELKTVEKMCVVKCALKKAMNLDEEQFDVFRTHVDKLVNLISRMLRRASLALAFHTTRLAAMDPPATVPDLYDMKDTYWKDWLRIGIDGAFPDEESKASYAAIEGTLGDVLDPDSADELVYVRAYPAFFDQVLNYAGHTLSTVVSNNAWVPLFARLARLTKKKLKRLGAEQSAYKVMQAIRSETQEMDGWPAPVQAYVHEVRSRLQAAPGARLYDGYGKLPPCSGLTSGCRRSWRPCSSGASS